jgi:hypothetical protein
MIKFFSPHQKSKSILFSGKDLVNKIIFSYNFTKLVINYSDVSSEVIVSSSYFQDGMEFTKEKWAIRVSILMKSHFSIFEEILTKRLGIRNENDFWTLHMPSTSDEDFVKFSKELEKMFLLEILKSETKVKNESY